MSDSGEVFAKAPHEGENIDVRYDLFVYGTLMSMPIVKSLIKREPAWRPALLQGYHRYCIKDQPYPAILPQEGSQVWGVMLTELSDKEMRIFDEYEDECYSRVLATVNIATETSRENWTTPPSTAGYPLDPDGKSALIYVWKYPDHIESGLLLGAWEFEKHFSNELEQQYVDMCSRFADAGYVWSESEDDEAVVSGSDQVPEGVTLPQT